MGNKKVKQGYKFTILLTDEMVEKLDTVSKTVFRGMNRSQTVRCLIEDSFKLHEKESEV